MAEYHHIGQWTDHLHGNRGVLGVGALLGTTAVAAALPVAQSAPAALAPTADTCASVATSMLGSVATGLAQALPVVGPAVAILAMHGPYRGSLVIP